MIFMLGYPVKVIAFVLIVSFSFACGSSGGADPDRSGSGAGDNESPNVQITIAKSEARDIPAVIQATGTLAADESSNVAPKIAGKIANISVNVGQFVRGGEIIARVDDQDGRLRLASAEAAVKKAEASVLQAQARLGLTPGRSFDALMIPEVRAANANYEQAVAELRQAEANEKRYRELVESGDVALITYEQFRTARDTARARANSAKEQLDSAVNVARQSNQAIVSAMADVEAARTQVNDARQAIADTIIRAPFPGFVSSRPVAVGEYVSSASIVATILKTNPIKAQIQIAEADIPFVVVGRGLSLQVDAYKDRRFAGTVSAINPAVDPVSRSASIEALIENGDNALRSGMFTTVRINREGGGTGVFVPKSAVYNDQSTQSFRVFVIQEGVAKLRVVQLGIDEGDFIQIVSGVEADETVATGGLSDLYEGAKVSI